MYNRIINRCGLTLNANRKERGVDILVPPAWTWCELRGSGLQPAAGPVNTCVKAAHLENRAGSVCAGGF